MYQELLNRLDELTNLLVQILSKVDERNSSIPPIKSQWLDSADIKQLLKISDSSLYRLKKNNLIPAKRISGKWYYQLPEFDSRDSAE